MELDAIREAIKPVDVETDTGRLRFRKLLHAEIDSRFDLREFELLLHDMGLDPENFSPEEAKTQRTLQLVLYMQRHGRTTELLDALAKKRPFIDWKKLRNGG